MGSILKAFCLSRCKNGPRNLVFLNHPRGLSLDGPGRWETQLKKGDVNRRTSGNEVQRQRARSAVGPVTRRKEELLTHVLGPSYCQGQRTWPFWSWQSDSPITNKNPRVIQQSTIASLSHQETHHSGSNEQGWPVPATRGLNLVKWPEWGANIPRDRPLVSPPLRQTGTEGGFTEEVALELDTEGNNEDDNNSC